MAIRDRASDLGRLGSPGQDRADFGAPMDFGASTLAEQNAAGGWNKADLPVGGVPASQEHTVGSAEAE
jgi:hypothetical protein